MTSSKSVKGLFKSLGSALKGQHRSPTPTNGSSAIEPETSLAITDGEIQSGIYLTAPSSTIVLSERQTNAPRVDEGSQARTHSIASSTSAIPNISESHDNATLVIPGSDNTQSTTTTVQIQGQGTHFFAGANVAINNSTMIDLGQPSENTREALKRLEKRRLPGAEVDSSAREPAPRCHPNTRKELRKKLLTWLDDPGRTQSMIWILGPAGVGKSAIAQTIAEHCKAIGRLGAAFFFSRLNDRHDPLRVVLTLVHQLTVLLPEYKRLIIQRLMDDTTILEKNLRSQFRILIIEPLTVLRNVINDPLLIILDGLDECNDHDAQRELISLIAEQVQQMDYLPVLWLICSRPEWHLKRMFRGVNVQQNCLREQILIDDPEAQQDVIDFLRDEFTDIRERFWDVINVDDDKPWPTEVQLGRLATAASGLFIFASTVLKFIGNENQGHDNKAWGTPITRLELCLKAINNSDAFDAARPLQMLDLLYQQILSTIPTDILPTTMRILRLNIFFRHAGSFYAQDISNILLLDQSTFYNSLRWLHSVLEIPTPAEAARQPLQFYHASFGDFLQDPSRSGPFALNKAKVQHDTALLLFRWYNRTLKKKCKLKDKSMCCSSTPELTWGTGGTEYEDVLLTRFGSFTNRGGLKACFIQDSEYIPATVTEISGVHFCHQPRLPRPTPILTFVEWLHSLDDQNNGLIRLAPNCETDHRLLQRYGRPMEPAKVPKKISGFHVLSLHQKEEVEDCKPFGMFFLGHDTRTCLVLVTHPW